MKVIFFLKARKIEKLGGVEIGAGCEVRRQGGRVGGRANIH